MINTDSRGFTIDNLNELNKEHSPSIPIGFPKFRLPGKFLSIIVGHFNVTSLIRNFVKSLAYKS